MSNETEQVFLPDSASNQRPALLLRPGNGGPTINTINLENVEDFTKVCRICATVTDLVMPIFSGEGLRIDLADKIKRHLPIKVSATDALPVVVCYQCASTLLATHELVACSQQADAALRTALSAQERNARQRQTQQQSQPVKQEPAARTEDRSGETDIALNDMVKAVLVNYFHTMNMDHDDDYQLACQKCSWRSTSFTEGLVEHLNAHKVKVAAVEGFIRQYITFEQCLDLDNEGPANDSSEEPPPLPAHCCPFCNSIFSSTARLGLHIAEHVEICEDSAVECCDLVFNDRSLFIQHAQDKHGRAPPPGIVCRACGHRAETPSDLADHIKKTHADDAITRRRLTEAKRVASSKDQKYIPTACPECGKTFSNKYNMAVHARSHRAKPEKFSCERCGRGYGSRGALLAHGRLQHGGSLRFACRACGERFPSRAARAVHAALHTGERPHACSEPGCTSAFRGRNSLLRHLDAHKDVRAYACLCGKAFRRGSHLKTHIKTHHSESHQQASDTRTEPTTGS